MSLTIPSCESLLEIESPSLLDVPIEDIAMDLIEKRLWSFPDHAQDRLSAQDDDRLGEFWISICSSYWGRVDSGPNENHRGYDFTVTDDESGVYRYLRVDVSRGSRNENPVVLSAIETVGFRIETADSTVHVSRVFGRPVSDEWGLPIIKIEAKETADQIHIDKESGRVLVSEFMNDRGMVRSQMSPDDAELNLFNAAFGTPLYHRKPGCGRIVGEELSLRGRRWYRDYSCWFRV